MPQVDFPRSFEVQFAPQWPAVRRIRQQVDNFFAQESQDYALYSIKAASELIENAIKYSRFDSTEPCSFKIVRLPAAVVITVSHEAAPEHPYAQLANQVARISTAANKSALYEERLLELAQTSGSGSRLGLLWMAGEGRFELQSAQSGRMITMTAKRSVP